MKWLIGAAIGLKLQWDVFWFKRRATLLKNNIVLDFEDFLLQSHMTAYKHNQFLVMSDFSTSNMEH
jgi:hypothetical protein